MTEIPFHATRMGHRFYESTMPALVAELARLNANLERLVAATEAHPSESGRDTDEPEPEAKEAQDR